MPQDNSKNSDTDAGEIKTITFVESVRQRQRMYIPSKDGEGLCFLVRLAMLQAVEPHDIVNGRAAPGRPATQIDVTLHPDDSVTATDNGRGLPLACAMNETLPEAQRTLTSGFVGDHNGAAIVNALSQQFHVTIWRDGGIWEQSYSRGEPISELRQTGETEKHGTSFHFLPDPEVFSVNKYEASRLRRVMNEFVSEYKDVTLTLTDERETDPVTSEPQFFQFKNVTA